MLRKTGTDIVRDNILGSDFGGFLGFFGYPLRQFSTTTRTALTHIIGAVISAGMNGYQNQPPMFMAGYIDRLNLLLNSSAIATFSHGLAPSLFDLLQSTQLETNVFISYYINTACQFNVDPPSLEASARLFGYYI